MRSWTCGLLALVLAGCAGQPGGNWVGANTAADAGERPEHYEELAEEYVRAQLLDPDSLKQFSATPPVLARCAIGVYGPFHGWRSTVTYNAKNVYGGYVGVQTAYLWFNHGRVARVSAAPTYCP